MVRINVEPGRFATMKKGRSYQSVVAMCIGYLSLYLSIPKLSDLKTAYVYYFSVFCKLWFWAQLNWLPVAQGLFQGFLPKCQVGWNSQDLTEGGAPSKLIHVTIGSPQIFTGWLLARELPCGPPHNVVHVVAFFFQSGNPREGPQGRNHSFFYNSVSKVTSHYFTLFFFVGEG